MCCDELVMFWLCSADVLVTFWHYLADSIRVIDDTSITFKLTTLSCAVITAVLSSLEDGGGPWLAVTVKHRNDSGGYNVT